MKRGDAQRLLVFRWGFGGLVVPIEFERVIGRQISILSLQDPVMREKTQPSTTADTDVG